MASCPLEFTPDLWVVLPPEQEGRPFESARACHFSITWQFLPRPDGSSFVIGWPYYFLAAFFAGLADLADLAGATGTAGASALLMSSTARHEPSASFP